MFFKGKTTERLNAPASRPAAGDTRTPCDDKPFLEKILLVVDGSLHSMQAADFAVRLATRLGTCLQAAFIVDTATLDYLLQMHIFIEEERAEMEADLELKGQRYLERVKEIAAHAGLPLETFIVRGRQHQAVLHLARREHAAAIVLGGWYRESRQKDLTSVERQLILDLAECPVFVIKDNVHADGFC